MRSRFWLSIILFCFSFLLVPKNFWHDCEHHKHEHNSQELSFENSELDCAVCDFELFQLSCPFFEKNTGAAYDFKLCTSPTFFKHLTVDYLDFNKGPPISC